MRIFLCKIQECRILDPCCIGQIYKINRDPLTHLSAFNTFPLKLFFLSFFCLIFWLKSWNWNLRSFVYEQSVLVISLVSCFGDWRDGIPTLVETYREKRLLRVFTIKLTLIQNYFFHNRYHSEVYHSKFHASDMGIINSVIILTLVRSSCLLAAKQCMLKYFFSTWF